MDGQHDPVGESVDQAVEVAGAGRAGGEWFGAGESLCLEVVDQLGPPCGCVPGEGGVKSAAGQVLRCPGPCGVLLVIGPCRGDGFPCSTKGAGGVDLFGCGGVLLVEVDGSH